MLLTRVSNAAEDTKAQALMLLFTPSDLPLPAKLAGEFGLTSAQRRVAALATRGLGPGDVSRELTRDYETARSHLRELREKTRTRSRAELVRTLVVIAAVTGQGASPKRVMT